MGVGGLEKSQRPKKKERLISTGCIRFPKGSGEHKHSRIYNRKGQ